MTTTSDDNRSRDEGLSIDYPLAEVLGTSDLIHQARPVGRFGSRIETRCGLQGNKTGRDGGIWCPECKARQVAKTATQDDSHSRDEEAAKPCGWCDCEGCGDADNHVCGCRSQDEDDRAMDERVAAIQAHVNDAVRRAVAEHHTWRGLMALLDEHYPADVQLGDPADPGPRILALTREMDLLRARLDGLGEERVLMYRIIGAIEHAYALNTYVQLEPGETAPTVESLWAEVRELRGVAPDAAPTACRSCGTTERVHGDPPLCSNCAVYAPPARGRLGLATEAVETENDLLRTEPEDGEPTTFLLLPQGQSAEQAVRRQRDRADQARYELGLARLEIAKLRLVAGSMLRTFTKSAGPRRTARRSVPVPVTDIEQWRAVVHPHRDCADAAADGHSLVGEIEQENHG